MEHRAKTAQQTHWMSLANIKTKPKVLFSVAVPLLLTLCIGAVALINLERMNYRQGWVDHTQRVLARSTEIIASAVDMETGMRGYLLAGREQFLEPYESGDAAAFSALAELRKTVGDNPPQVARLQKAEDVLRQWKADVTEPQIALRRAIGDAPTMNDMADVVGKGEGKAYFDKFRAVISTFIRNEETLLVQRKADFEAILSRGTATEKVTREAMTWVDHTYKAIITAQDILAAALDMETGMRGFLVAGDEVFLDPFNAGTTTFRELIQELSETVSDNPAQVAVLAEAEATIDGWLTNVVTPMLELRKKIGDAETMDDMADLAGEARGKRYFDGFRQLMADFSAEEETLMVSRQAENVKTRKMTQAMIAIAVVASIVIGLIVAWVVGANIGNAIQGLTNLMGRLANGDNSVEITGQNRGDEVGEMARATEVFKQNAIKAQDLALEVKEKEKRGRAREAAERERDAKLEEDKRAVEVEERRKEQARMQTLETFQKDMERVLGEAASGNFTIRMSDNIEDAGLAGLAQVVNRLLKTTETNISDIVASIDELSKGNLGTRIDGDRQGAFLRMKEDFNRALTTLSATMAQIMQNGHSVSGTSSELESSSLAMAKRSEDNAVAVEETSAAVEQISASIRQVVENAKAANDATRKVKESAAKTREISNETEASISAMTEASSQINNVVKVIEDIAFQINLLALNAGVEAARAGESGRGFSVVASEVRALAQRSQEAVQEIGRVIEENNRSVEVGVEKVGLSRKALESILEEVEVASRQISEITYAVEEQATGIEEVNSAIRTIDTATQTNAAALEEMTAASVSLSGDAKSLSASLTQFQGVTEYRAEQTINVVPMTANPHPKAAEQSVRKITSAGRATIDSGWDEF